MNRLQLVQVIIIVAVMLFGYQMIISLFDFVRRVVNDWPEAGYGRTISDFRFTTFLPGVLALTYAIALVLLLRFAPNISLFIVDRVGIDDSFILGVSDKSVVYATILFLSFSTLIQKIPTFILQSAIMIQESFEVTDPNSAWHPQIDFYDLLLSLFQIIFCFIILFKIKMIVNFFHSKIDPIDAQVFPITSKE